MTISNHFFSVMPPELCPYTSKILIICDGYGNSDLFGNMLYIWLLYGPVLLLIKAHADIALWAKAPNSDFRLNLYPYIV